jgi:hypothetical protein
LPGRGNQLRDVGEIGEVAAWWSWLGLHVVEGLGEEALREAFDLGQLRGTA